MKLYFTVVGQAQWGVGVYQLVTVYSHGDFIVLPHCPDDLLSHFSYPDTEPPSPRTSLIMQRVELGSEKYQIKVIGLT